MSDDVSSVIDHTKHSRFSSPGQFTALLEGVPTDPVRLSVISRNLIVHYRASGHELASATRGEINARWLEEMLGADQSRHALPLAEPRELVDRVQGCCRDHTLFCVGALRSNGIPARSRVGFAGYFVEGWHHDHVIVEAWLNGRWQRFDSELDGPKPALPTPMDIGHCELEATGFVTAAQAWAGYRKGEIDPETYGVDPTMPVFRGPRFLFDEVIYEVAHRFGDEMLLWDGWGRIGYPGEPVSDDDAAWLDAVAGLLIAADLGHLDAELELLRRYRLDDGLHPGATVIQASPFGDPLIEVNLDRPEAS